MWKYEKNFLNLHTSKGNDIYVFLKTLSINSKTKIHD